MLFQKCRHIGIFWNISARGFLSLIELLNVLNGLHFLFESFHFVEKLFSVAPSLGWCSWCYKSANPTPLLPIFDKSFQENRMFFNAPFSWSILWFVCFVSVVSNHVRPRYLFLTRSFIQSLGFGNWRLKSIHIIIGFGVCNQTRCWFMDLLWMTKSMK